MDLVKINIRKEDREILKEMSREDGRHIYKIFEMLLKEHIDNKKLTK